MQGSRALRWNHGCSPSSRPRQPHLRRACGVAGAQTEDKDSLQILVEPEADSLPLMETNTYKASESWDYVLVADRRTRRNQQFLENLKKKGFRYEVKEDQDKVFFGIRAGSQIFDLYCALLLETEGPAPKPSAGVRGLSVGEQGVPEAKPKEVMAKQTPIPPTTR